MLSEIGSREPYEGYKTLVAIVPCRLPSDMHVSNRVADSPEEQNEQTAIRIRLAQSNDQVKSASMLVQRKYASRGYKTGGIQKDPWRITFMALQGDIVIGTLTLGLDSPKPLMVEDLYRHEVVGLRDQGRKVCELTKLAVDQVRESKRVLASLFHVAYIYGRLMQGHDDVLIEVNPRHVGFYKRMLGFTELGPERMCRRVNAPAILLRLDLDYVDRQIALLAGKADTTKGVHSLYPYFYGKSDEIGITQLCS
jgi:hypothetical protein